MALKKQADMNNTLLTWPKRKKTKAVRNAYNENHATYKQLTKLLVCDKRQAFVDRVNESVDAGLVTLTEW